MAYLNNIIDNFYENLNNFGTNPFVLIVLIIIIIMILYYSSTPQTFFNINNIIYFMVI